MKRFDYPALGECVYRKTLPNGLPVAVIPRPGFTRKLAYFVTDYGAIHKRFTVNSKPVNTPAGVAHYLEHKLFDMPDRDVTEEFAALGANPNAFTSYDMTAYYFSCTENFKACLKLLLEFVSTPYFTEESVAKEQGIIAQEIGMNEDSPDTRVFENLMTCMYPAHPVNTPILGDRESIAQITPQVLTQCHNAFYRPDNMLLCVIGDVDPEQVCQIASEILPGQAGAPTRKAPVPQEEMLCHTHYTEQTMEVAMPMFQLGFKCEPPEPGDTSVFREAVGDLAAEALFGESSPLYLRLYQQGLIDNSFAGGYESVDGMAMLTASGDSLDPNAVTAAILEQAQLLAEQGIPETDFLRMKRSALGRRIRDLDSFDSTAFRLCAYHFSQFDYFRFPHIYQAVQEQDVLDFIRQTVKKERHCLSVIVPKEVSENGCK